MTSDENSPNGGRTGGGEIGTLLREFRRSRVVTQERTAELAGLSVRTVRYLESGRIRRPHQDTVARLARGLELTASERLLLERASRTEAEAPEPRPGPPSTLPPSTPDFCGREEEVARLLAAMSADPPVDGALVVWAVAGSPGVGKTALALHVAHRLRTDGRFPDGQLHVDLGGAGTSPADPADVLGRFLVALGVDAAGVPEGLDDRGDRYRTLLRDRRLLVVLDNAATEAQVRPLLPGAGGSAVLVTSRNRLPGLEGAHHLDLEVLPPAPAVQLLARVAGEERVAAEPESARAIVDFCQGLPLALRIAGARLAGRPDWALAGMARRLEDEHGRLDELEAGDLAVRAGFAMSYRSLPASGRRLFRRLALLDQADVPAWSAGALVDVPSAAGTRLLEQLRDANLVESAGQDALGQDRYRLHDLLRLYAAELLGGDPAAERREALSRVAGGWLALADLAAPAVPAGTLHLIHGDAPRRPPTAAVRELVRAAPLEWLDVEHRNLTALVLQATSAGLDDAAWDLAGCLAVFYAVQTSFDDWRRSQEAGLRAARQAGHLLAEAHMLRGLGHLRSEQDSLDIATEAFEQARELFVAAGDRRGEASALDDLGVIAHLNGRTDVAVRHLDRAVAAFADAGDRTGQAHVRFSLGMVHLDQGRHAEAEVLLLEAKSALEAAGDCHTQAQILRKLAQLYRTTDRLERAAIVLEECLAIERGLSDRLGEALTVQSLGEVRRRQDRRHEARALLETALEAFRATGYQYGEALALRSLGDLQLAESRPRPAVTALRTSLAIWQHLGRPRNEAHTLASMGAAYAMLGDADRARSARSRALDLYRQLDAPEAGALAEQLVS